MSPVALITSVPPPKVASAQATWVPLHVPGLAPPFLSSTTASKLDDPTTVIVWAVATALNLYQTSSFVVPPHVVEMPELVADATLPAVVTQLVPEVNVVAPEQLSFAGCAKAVVTTNVNPKIKAVSLSDITNFRHFTASRQLIFVGFGKGCLLGWACSAMPLRG